MNSLPVANTNSIINFDPFKIKRIDIIPRKYYYGNLVKDGIASYSTYDGDLSTFPLNSSNVVIQFAGLQLEREFYSPVYYNISLQK